MTGRIQGPDAATQRVSIRGQYVELRQARWSDRFGWSVEHGSERWGHRGTWGRNSYAEALACFLSAIERVVVG